jgi:hypothetical protein
MDKNIESDKVNPVSAEVKSSDKNIDPKVAKEETTEIESKRDKLFASISKKINNLIPKGGKEEKKLGAEVEKPAIGKIPLNWKKLLPFSPLLLIILFALYVQIFGKGKPAKENLSLPPTPTYSPYQKFKPSIYADDPQVTKLEEALNVLDREMKTTPLTEGTLTPPVLDFKIDF